MAKPKIIIMAGALVAIFAALLFFGGDLYQFAQPGEPVHLGCASKAECIAVLQRDGATPEQANEFVDQYVTCSAGVCTYKVQGERGG